MASAISSDRYWPKAAARLMIDSAAGTDPNRSFAIEAILSNPSHESEFDVMLKIVPALALLVGSSATVVPIPPLDEQPGDIQQALRSWRDAGISDYKFSYDTKSLFCDLGVENNVKIRDSELVSTSSDLDPCNERKIDLAEYSKSGMTVEGLFELIEECQEEYPVIAHFHPDLGFPTFIFCQASAQNLSSHRNPHATVVIKVSEFEVL